MCATESYLQIIGENRNNIRFPHPHTVRHKHGRHMQ